MHMDTHMHTEMASPDPKHPIREEPCVRLEKAMYGHPVSGRRWQTHADKALRKEGWEPIMDGLTLYRRVDKEGMAGLLLLYVDDAVLSSK